VSSSTPNPTAIAATTAPPASAATITSTVVPRTSPAENTAHDTTSSPGLLTGALLSGALLAAVVGAVVNTALARRKSLEEERARVRGTFAEAFEAVMAYKEFPYAIRRRRHDQPEQERVRLSEALREVQSRLSYYLAWTKAESDDVGDRYKDLVRNLKIIAGTACHDAWLAPPALNDSDINIRPTVVDLSGLAAYEDAYIAATQEHLAQLLSSKRLWRKR
jgi:hypothetical protein